MHRPSLGCSPAVQPHSRSEVADTGHSGATRAALYTRRVSSPEITAADVAHLARLARIDIPADRLAYYAEQLEVILGSVAKVSEVAGADVPATSHPQPLTNVFREDARAASLTAEQALGGAPSVETERFRVPRILDEEA